MPDDAFAHACRIAGPDTTGTLVFVARDDVIDLAVVLAPEEPLSSARRAFFAGMVALAEAIGAQAPPQIPVVIAWPDTLMFNGARLGGGRLGWPKDCAEDAVPDWLVFAGMVIASKSGAGDPGLTPDSTSLEEEAFPADGRAEIVESFARNLMKAFEVWEQEGFDAVAGRYLRHVPAGGD
ncbi:MAG TPA: biotin/lipoate--protein ligase family protein, partial [Methylobacterium sp.]